MGESASRRRMQEEQIFKKYDEDNNGYIDGRELMNVIKDIFPKQKVKKVYVENLLGKFDYNMDGVLNPVEFRDLYKFVTEAQPPK